MSQDVEKLLSNKYLLDEIVVSVAVVHLCLLNGYGSIKFINGLIENELGVSADTPDW